MLSDCQVHSYSECCNAPLLGLSHNNSDSYSQTGQREEKEKQKTKQKSKQDYRYKPCCFIGFFVYILISCKNILKYANKGNGFFKFIDWKEGG